MRKEIWKTTKQYEGPKSVFLTVKCTVCSNEQTIFSKPSSDIKCLVCGSVLAAATGGNGDIKAKVVHVIDG